MGPIVILSLLGAAVAVLIAYLWVLPIANFEKGSVRNKSVIITGASYGIGKEIALLYCSLGANVVLVSRTEGKLSDVVNECMRIGASSASYVAADLSTQDDNVFKQIIDESVLRLNGSIDSLILNHVSTKDLFIPEGWDKKRNITLVRSIFNTNTFSFMSLTHHSLDYLERSAEGGKIIVVSSLTGVLGMPNVAAYSSTKHALHGFFNSLRLDLRMSKSNISITMCLIGSVKTEANKKVLEGRDSFVDAAPPEDAAKAIVFGGEVRFRDVYYPVLQTYPIHLLSTLIPSAIDRLLKFIFSQNHNS